MLVNDVGVEEGKADSVGSAVGFEDTEGEVVGL